MTARTSQTPDAVRAARVLRNSAADPGVRFRDLFAAEWIKLWTLRSTRYVLGLGTLLFVGIAVQKSLGTYQDWPSFRPAEKAHFDPMTEAFSGVTAALLMIGAGCVGALAIVGEYATGSVRTTFTAVPARHLVMTAKVTVLAVVMLGVGAVVSLATFAVSQAILSGRGIGLTLGDPGGAHVLVANALLAPISALAGLGLGALLRHTAASVVTCSAVLVVVPTFFKPTVHQWVNDLYAMFPNYVWRTCLAMRDPRDLPGLPTTAAAWTVFALWPLATAVLAVLAVQRRDL
ncbi:ABC transporter permease [Actinomadura sp. NAK00032]|uniref:ABC transporter permease subunit n=1 Tax=Actinomadura sp. NAK00032 TaxID=2742128 RepID=UPI0015915270|nr:ABC transporter permease subunit [Actinomadura sp. NAK00032]QKW33549.1 ABC transporter permease [Actinomadura sp. NAK00032]